MACNHPRETWVGTADGIHCGLCGQLINDKAPKPVQAPEAEIEKEPEEKPVKKAAAPKKGGKK